MNIRTRRLRRDYEKILEELSSSEFVKVRVVSGDPPSHYQVTYNVCGLEWDDLTGSVVPRGEHVIDIYLPPGYPKERPKCTMCTSIWHPNIGDYICTDDFWSAGMTLADVIVQIGDMIQYKSYNILSPLNKAAAAWAKQHHSSLPVGTRTIRSAPVDTPNAEPEVEIEIEIGSVRRDEPEVVLGEVREARTQGL